MTKLPCVRKLKNKTIPIISLLAVVLYALAIEYFYGWHTLVAAWSNVPLWKISAALVLMFCTYLIRGLRIHYYFLPLTRGHLQQCLKIMLMHNLLNNLLPMRTGEASFPVLMQRYFGLSFTAATAGLVLLRLLDLHVLVCIGGVVITAYVGVSKWFWWCLSLAIFLPLLLVPCAPMLRAYYTKLAPGKLHNIIAQLTLALPRSFTQLVCLWLYTWLCWVTKIGVFTLVLLWFANTHWLNALGAAFGGELSSVIPIHPPGGLGTYEASMLGTARLLGIKDDWVLFAAVQLHLMILLSTLLGGLAAQVIGERNINSSRAITIAKNECGVSSANLHK